MREFDEATITDAVLERVANTPNSIIALPLCSTD
jgi:hypothetical protein